MEALTIEEARALDENAEFLGISRLQLMENAGKAVAESLKKETQKKIVIVAYTGNKGGDGFVAARHLASMGAQVSVVLLSKPDHISTAEAMANYLVLSRTHSVKLIISPCLSDAARDEIGSADILVDAMLGTGAKGSPAGVLKGAVEACNASKAFKVAIDLPSGLNACEKEGGSNKAPALAFKADLTVTYHKPKTVLLTPHAKGCVGKLEVASIGMPPEVEMYAGPGDLRLALKQRDEYVHKGQSGRILVIGGSSKYSGAPTLAALAALNSGSDIVVLAVPSSLVTAVRGFSPNLIVASLDSSNEFDKNSLAIARKEAKDADVVVMGMGMCLKAETQSALNEFVDDLVAIGKPLVIDADALKALGGEGKGPRPGLKLKGAVLTPHTGEFAALTGVKLPDERDAGWQGRLDVVKEWAEKLGTTILLKSRYDIITDGSRYKIKTIGNPGLAIGGTGDVLAGITGAIMARGMSPYRSAVAASFLNAYAGDLLAEKKGQHFTATDLVHALPYALKKLDL